MMLSKILNSYSFKFYSLKMNVGYFTTVKIIPLSAKEIGLKELVIIKFLDHCHSIYTLSLIQPRMLTTIRYFVRPNWSQFLCNR